MTPLLVIRWSRPSIWQPSTAKRLRDGRAVQASLDVFARIAEPSLQQDGTFDELAARLQRVAEWAVPEPVRAASPTIGPQRSDEPLPDDGRVVLPFRRQVARGRC